MLITLYALENVAELLQKYETVRIIRETTVLRGTA